MEVVKKFLSYFGNPLVKFYQPPVKVVEPSKMIKWSLLEPLETLLAKNDKLPYPLHFTPNGNFGDTNTQYGQKYSITKGMEGKQPLRNAIYVDCDMKDTEYTNLDEYFDALRNVIESKSIRYPTPTFINKSGGGFHLYRLLDTKTRNLISKRLTIENMQAIQRYFSENTIGGDLTKGREYINAGARLPFSKYWTKDGTTKPMQLYQVIRDDDGKITYKPINDVKDFDDEKLIYSLGWLQIETARSFIKRNLRKDKDEAPINVSTNAAVVEDQVKKLPFPEVIEKLKNYPKRFGGFVYNYKIVANKLFLDYIERPDNGPLGVVTNDGYTYEKEKNYINNFACTDADHPVEERAHGNVMSFLYWHFDKKMPRVLEFLMKEFNINASSNKSMLDGDQILWQIIKPTYKIFCTSANKIFIQQDVAKKDGSTVVIDHNLFLKSFQILGKGRVDFKDIGESDVGEYVLICKTYVDDKPFLLKTHAAKRPLNDDLIKYGMFFYGDDNQLGLFYQAVLEDLKIPEYEIIHLNGYYEGIYILGGKVFEMEPHDRKYYFMPRFEYRLKLGTQVSCEEFMKKGLGLRDPTCFIPSFLQALALAGMNVWNDVPGVSVYPGLFLTGDSATGKTILTEALTGMLGYAKKERQYSITRITPQPLMHAATDNSILNLEEFTGDNINPNIQNPLRDIIDRRTASKGMIGRNLVFRFRSPLLVLGQTLPDMTSVTNRFVVIPMDKRYQLGNPDGLHEIDQLSVTNEVYATWYRLRNEKVMLGDCYRKRVKYLIDNNIDSRYADARAFIFVANELFDLKLNEDTILGYMKINLKNIGYYGEKRILSPYAKFHKFLVQAMMKRKIHVTLRTVGQHDVITIVFDDDWIHKRVSELAQVVNDMNQELEQWLAAGHGHPDRVYEKVILDDCQLVVKIGFKYSSPMDVAMTDFKDKFLIMLGPAFVSIPD